MIFLTVGMIAALGGLVYLASCEFTNFTIEWAPEGRNWNEYT